MRDSRPIQFQLCHCLATAHNTKDSGVLSEENSMAIQMVFLHQPLVVVNSDYFHVMHVGR